MKQVYAQAGIKLCAKAICARRCAVEPADAHMTCIHLMSWNAIVDLTCKFINLRQNLSSTPKAMAKLQIQSSRKLTLKKSNPDSLFVVCIFSFCACRIEKCIWKLMDCSFGCFRHQLSLQTIMSRGKSYKALSPLHLACTFLANFALWIF